MSYSPSTATHVLDDRYKIPSRMDVLAFPEPLLIITRSFVSSATQRKMMSVYPEGNLIIYNYSYWSYRIASMYFSLYIKSEERRHIASLQEADQLLHHLARV